MQIAIHDKTKGIYLVLGLTKNCTNSVPLDQQVMVKYQNLYGREFVRERKEFYEKFTIVDAHDLHHVDRKTGAITSLNSGDPHGPVL